MSSITMAADSTQTEVKVDVVSFGRKKKKKKDKFEKGKRKDKTKKTATKKKKSTESDSDCESDLDLAKELRPIGGYIRDRETTIGHLFRSISTKKMKAMLPEILKPIAVDDLKRLCLEQLECMSRKRIKRILQGADPETISSSGTDDEELSTDYERPRGGSTGDDSKSDIEVDSTCRHSLDEEENIDAAGEEIRSAEERSPSPDGSRRSRSWSRSHSGSRSPSGSRSYSRSPHSSWGSSSRYPRDHSPGSDSYGSHESIYSSDEDQDGGSSTEEEIVEEVVVEEIYLEEGEDLEEVLRRTKYASIRDVSKDDSQKVEIMESQKQDHVVKEDSQMVEIMETQTQDLEVDSEGQKVGKTSGIVEEENQERVGEKVAVAVENPKQMETQKPDHGDEKSEDKEIEQAKVGIKSDELETNSVETVKGTVAETADKFDDMHVELEDQVKEKMDVESTDKISEPKEAETKPDVELSGEVHEVMDIESSDQISEPKQECTETEPSKEISGELPKSTDNSQKALSTDKTGCLQDEETAGGDVVMENTSGPMADSNSGAALKEDGTESQKSLADKEVISSGVDMKDDSMNELKVLPEESEESVEVETKEPMLQEPVSDDVIMKSDDDKLVEDVGANIQDSVTNIAIKTEASENTKMEIQDPESTENAEVKTTSPETTKMESQDPESTENVSAGVDDAAKMPVEEEEELEEGEIADTSSDEEPPQIVNSESDRHSEDSLNQVYDFPKTRKSRPARRSREKPQKKKKKKTVKVVKRIIKVIRRKGQSGQGEEISHEVIGETVKRTEDSTELENVTKKVKISSPARSASRQESTDKGKTAESSVKPSSTGMAKSSKTTASDAVGKNDEQEDSTEDKALNKMAILELEMRARAIKAMLRKQEEQERKEEKQQTKSKRIKLKRN